MPLRSPTDLNDNPSAATSINSRDHDHASILPLCTGLARRITSFLNSDPGTPLLKAVQEQTRIALGVIDTALERYS
jgi:FAD synthetase